MFYVYILKSINTDNIYVGCTNNVKERLKVHNEGKSFHTSKYRPWKLEFYSAFKTKELAFEFEKYLKTPNGKQMAKKHFLGSTCAT